MDRSSRTRVWNEDVFTPGYPRRTPGLKLSVTQRPPAYPASTSRRQSLARSDTFQSNSSSSTQSSFWSEAPSSPSSPTSASSISNYPHSIARTTDLLESFDRMNLVNTARDPWDVNSYSDMPPVAFQQPDRRPLFDVGEALVEEPLDIELPCTFSFYQCTATYRSKVEWEQHNLEHLEGLTPPSQMICIFCDVKFNNHDATLNWELRMQHIFGHHVGRRVPGERPDFELIKYLFNNGRMDRSRYDYLVEYSEVSDHMDLNPPGTQAPPTHKWNQKPNTRHNVWIDQRKQEREVKEERAAKKRGKGKR